MVSNRVIIAYINLKVKCNRMNDTDKFSDMPYIRHGCAFLENIGIGQLRGSVFADSILGNGAGKCDVPVFIRKR